MKRAGNIFTLAIVFRLDGVVVFMYSSLNGSISLLSSSLYTRCLTVLGGGIFWEKIKIIVINVISVGKSTRSPYTGHESATSSANLIVER